MEQVEFIEEPARVEAHLAADGTVRPKTIFWRGRQRAVTTVGRQWTEAGGRRVLVETSDGSRLELELRGEDLSWWVRRFWPGPEVAL
ncbi:MAG: hypothetical protein ACE5H9_00170 [Anaerolineae bacterium]